VRNDDDAAELSLAENTLRETMHPADEFEAFRALVDGGMAEADVAARFGVTEAVVSRRLRLARISPVVMDAYRGEAIVDSVYGEAEPTSPGRLFFVLNTESSFALGVGEAITELEGAYPGMGKAFYDGLRQALYRWIRVYDDLDARERIEQMTEWAEGEEDPESYEIPKLEQDLPPCLLVKQHSATVRPLASFPVPAAPWLRELVETTIELQRVSHSMERPRVDGEWFDRERDYYSLDLPLPAVLLYFRAGDAVMACFDDECEHWGQETPEPNLIIPLRADDQTSVSQALTVIETLMQVLVLTLRIKTIIESREEPTCDSASMSSIRSITD